MTLHQLIYFKKTAESQNITKAAGELYISQPSLSVSLRKLQEETGTELLHKNGRILTLTPAGKVFLEYADKILELVDELNDRMAEFRDQIQNRIRLGYISPLSRLYIPRLLTGLQEVQLHELRISAVVMNTHQVAHALLQGEIDLGLCCKIENIPSLIQVPVLEQKIVMVCSTEHPLAQKYGYGNGGSVHLVDLSEYDFISYVPGSQILEQLNPFYEEYDFVPRIKYTLDSEKEILELVKNNLGISVIALTDDVDRSEICCLELEDKSLVRSIYLTYCAKARHSDSIKNTIRFIENQARGL